MRRIVLFVLCALLLSACTPKEPPEAVAKRFMEAVKLLDQNAAMSCVANKDGVKPAEIVPNPKSTSSWAPAVLAMYSNFTYKVGAPVVTENTASVGVAVVGFDFPETLFAAMSKWRHMYTLVSKEHYSNLISDHMLSLTHAKKLTLNKNLAIRMRIVDGEWKIEANAQFIAALRRAITNEEIDWLREPDGKQIPVKPL